MLSIRAGRAGLLQSVQRMADAAGPHNRGRCAGPPLPGRGAVASAEVGHARVIVVQFFPSCRILTAATRAAALALPIAACFWISPAAAQFVCGAAGAYPWSAAA